MEAIEILGLVATLLGAFTFLPQTVKVLQRKKQGPVDLSSVPFRIYTAGAGLWMVFALLEKNISWSLLVANSMVIILNAPILYHLSKYSHATTVTYLFSVTCAIFVAVTFRLVMGNVDSPIFHLVASMIAGSFTGLAFIGQMIKSIKERRTKNIAMTFSSMMIVQSLMWIVYWVIKSSIAPENFENWISGIIWTTVEIMIMIPIFAFKVSYRIQLKKEMFKETTSSYVSLYDQFFKN